jgi:hypothetical protein
LHSIIKGIYLHFSAKSLTNYDLFVPEQLIMLQDNGKLQVQVTNTSPYATFYLKHSDPFGTVNTLADQNFINNEAKLEQLLSEDLFNDIASLLNEIITNNDLLKLPKTLNEKVTKIEEAGHILKKYILEVQNELPTPCSVTPSPSNSELILCNQVKFNKEKMSPLLIHANPEM